MPLVPVSSDLCKDRDAMKRGGSRSHRPSKVYFAVIPRRREATNPDDGTSDLAEQLVDIVPVDQVIAERLQIVGTAVAIVDVVGVLPDVAAEDRRRAMDQRAFAVRGLGDFELAVLDRQPAPAGAELADAGGGEIGLELLETAEVFGDLLFQTAGQLAAAAIWLHPVPEVQMVVVLAGIVEHGGILAERTLDDLFQGLAFAFGPLDRVVSVGHVSLGLLA